MSGYPHKIFLISPQKTDAVGTYKGLTKELLMSSHNICFQGEKRKISLRFWLKKKKVPYPEIRYLFTLMPIVFLENKLYEAYT